MDRYTIRDIIITLCVTAVVLAITGAIYESCDHAREARLECVKSGRAPAECGDSFAGNK